MEGWIDPEKLANRIVVADKSEIYRAGQEPGNTHKSGFYLNLKSSKLETQARFLFQP